MGETISRRSILAGLGAAGILVAVSEIPGARPATGESTESSVPTEISLSRLRTRRLFDDDGCAVGHCTVGQIQGADGAQLGSFASTELGGGIVAHEFLVGDSMLLGMGSGRRFAVVGAVGIFTGLTGGYLLEIEADPNSTTSCGRVRFI